MNTWIIAATSSKISSIVQAGGTNANLLIVGDNTLATELANCPVQRIVHIPITTVAENYTNTIAQWLKNEGVEIILAANLPTERALTAAVATACDASWVTNAVAWNTDTQQVQRSVSDLITEFYTVNGSVALTLPESDVPSGGNTPIETVAVEADYDVEVLERKQKSTNTANFTQAKKVICVGRGIKEAKDLDMIFTLGEKIKAPVGATRPLAEGYGWFDSYIGLTGHNVSAKLYIAIGVSGQIHHSGGIRNSDIIVAINDDEQAPIFNEADYGIVGDLYEIVPALINEL